MANEQDRTKEWLAVAVVCGTVASVCYALAMSVSISFHVNYFLFFAFGPFLMAAVVGIHHYVAQQRDGITLKFGTLFLIAAGIAVTMMSTMQGTIRAHLSEMRDAADGDLARQRIVTIWRAVDSTQQGLDMAFDIFISTGTFLLALALLRHTRFGWWFGLPGMVIAAGGFLLNAVAYPTINAGEAGYFDPGPLFGVFYGALTLKLAWCWIRYGEPSPASAI